MKKVTTILSTCLALATSVAFAGSPNLTITAERVSSNSVSAGEPLVVKFSITNNGPDQAPQSATFRIRFDDTYLTWVGATNLPNDAGFATGVTYGSAQSDGDMGAPVTSASPDSDASALPDYVDLATIGPPTFPATIKTPILAYAKFTVTAAGQAASNFQVAADVKDASTNHFPVISLAPPAVNSLDGVSDANLTFAPANITTVSDWTLLGE
ncbi:hypothetical protein GC173_01765 [bacterium]|nr:hypothetical protein [bacterium]